MCWLCFFSCNAVSIDTTCLETFLIASWHPFAFLRLSSGSPFPSMLAYFAFSTPQGAEVYACAYPLGWYSSMDQLLVVTLFLARAFCWAGEYAKENSKDLMLSDNFA